MERHDFSVSGEAERWVDAVEHGDEVFLTRDGQPVVRLEAAAKPVPQGSLNIAALHTLREAFADLRVPDGAALIRDLRDAGDH